MGHESFDHGERVVGSSNRSLGLVFAAVFGLVWLVPLLFGPGGPLWALIASGAFLVVAVVVPGLLGPLNRLWTRIGLVLHKIVSPIVLGIMFFLVITPMGLVMRLFGYDPLRLRMDRNASTYWIERNPPGPSADSFSDQF